MKKSTPSKIAKKKPPKRKHKHEWVYFCDIDPQTANMQYCTGCNRVRSV